MRLYDKYQSTWIKLNVFFSLVRSRFIYFRLICWKSRKWQLRRGLSLNHSQMKSVILFSFVFICSFLFSNCEFRKILRHWFDNGPNCLKFRNQSRKRSRFLYFQHFQQIDQRSEQIHKKAQGNPFVTQEMVQSLMEFVDETDDKQRVLRHQVLNFDFCISLF